MIPIAPPMISRKCPSTRGNAGFWTVLAVATQATTVNVEAIAVVQTDASNIAETKGALELTDLPVAIYTRSQGSTSAFSTLTAQPGVQTDANNNIQVAGGVAFAGLRHH